MVFFPWLNGLDCLTKQLLVHLIRERVRKWVRKWFRK